MKLILALVLASSATVGLVVWSIQASGERLAGVFGTAADVSLLTAGGQPPAKGTLLLVAVAVMAYMVTRRH